jgi:hypothetical protein
MPSKSYNLNEKVLEPTISSRLPVASSPDPATTQKELEQVLSTISIVDDVYLGM